jgi:hypothetical protein
MTLRFPLRLPLRPFPAAALRARFGTHGATALAAAALLRRQGPRAWTLARAELTRSARAGLRTLLPPDRWHFPLALFFYLFLVFALEVVFLKIFLPGEGPARFAAAPARADAAPAASQDPDQAEEFRTLADLYLPAMHARSPLPGQFLVLEAAPALAQLMAPENAGPLLLGGEEDLLLLADADRHPLLHVPTLAGPAPTHPASGPAAFDSVRMAVACSEVRMPVDPAAFHPQDKEAFLAAASDPRRLAAVFARVSPGLADAPALLAELPASAIAPPVTRLDRLRMAEARRRSLGALSAHFESGLRGVFAVGYDASGGTSYGKYQLSSRKGAIRNFIKYLDKRAPTWAQRLRMAGSADTGGTQGPMPREWVRIAGEHPRLFEKLQDDFIHSHYYSPTLQAVREQTGLDIETQNMVIREVLWSTAVHHGPTGGANIFITASMRARQANGDFGKALLTEVYRERERRLAKVPLSQRNALRSRLEREMSMALARLERAAFSQTHTLSARGGFM